MKIHKPNERPKKRRRFTFSDGVIEDAQHIIKEFGGVERFRKLTNTVATEFGSQIEAMDPHKGSAKNSFAGGRDVVDFAQELLERVADPETKAAMPDVLKQLIGDQFTGDSIRDTKNNFRASVIFADKTLGSSESIFRAAGKKMDDALQAGEMTFDERTNAVSKNRDDGRTIGLLHEWVMKAVKEYAQDMKIPLDGLEKSGGASKGAA